MHYFHLNSFGHLDRIADTLTHEQRSDRGWECRADRWNWDRAQYIAAQATVLSGDNWAGIDNGEWVSPRYDVARVPHVGDPVSYTFNGDYHPDGVIVSVSGPEKGFRIVKTDTGSVYYRRKTTDRWVKQGGTWSLVQGHVSRWNPEF